MPGSLLAALLALAALADARADEQAPAAERLSVGLPVEVTLVGLSYGLHPELLYRPFRPDGLLNLRAATGLMVGPELSLVPVSAGLRVSFLREQRFHPGLGVGVQLQTFLPREHEAVLRLDNYYELTASYEVAEGWHAGLQLSPELGVVPNFGLGMAARAGVQKDLPW